MENKKFFIVSDIHSFASEMKAALWKAGFRRSNKNDILIVCGDLFDRGNETLEVYNYVSTLPKNRRILIRGNHEELYIKLLEKSFPNSYDCTNGTIKTFCQIAKINPEVLSDYYWCNLTSNDANVWHKAQDSWNKVVELVKASPITSWLKSDEWVNFFELENYIFVHSFIPVAVKPEYDNNLITFAKYQFGLKIFEYWQGWRTATDAEWVAATWGNPGEYYAAGLFEEEEKLGKTIVCGHWHSAAFHEMFDGIINDYSIYYQKHFIAIDGCTAKTNNVNVLIIKNNECFDKYGNKLEERKHNQ